MWYYVQCDLVVGWLWLLYGLTVWYIILFLIYIMAESYTRLSGVKQEQSIFKSEFSSSFKKLKESKPKFSDINAWLDEIE